MRKHHFRDFLERARHGTAQQRQGSVALSERDYLLTMEIARDLSPEQIAMIERATVLRTIPKGQVISSQEGRADAFFLVKRGRVSCYRLTPGDRRLKLATIGPKAFSGEMPLLDESLRHACRLISVHRRTKRY
jgi:CRP-like cAMP-binding protein